ncbi:MAG: hypothetical protein IKO36_01805 [Bacteroidaceae bacterium]|nr:hypothetical protein [Bacteroidaceae bacterium]
MANVIVKYSDFSKDNSKVEKIILELLPNKIVVLELNEQESADETDAEAVNENNNITLSMVDKETDEIQISGSLDKETVNALIRSLNILRSQQFGEQNAVTR